MGEKGQFDIDLEDDVVRGSIVLDKGKMMWPPPAPATPPVAPQQAAKEKALVKPPELNPFQEKMYETCGTAGKFTFTLPAGLYSLISYSIIVQFQSPKLNSIHSRKI